jgi:hypothetical protein
MTAVGSVQSAQASLTAAKAQQKKDVATDAKAVTAASKEGAKALAAAVAQQLSDDAADTAAVARAQVAVAAAQAARGTSTSSPAAVAAKHARTDGTGTLIDTTA